VTDQERDKEVVKEVEKAKLRVERIRKGLDSHGVRDVKSLLALTDKLTLENKDFRELITDLSNLDAKFGKKIMKSLIITKAKEVLEKHPESK